MKNPEQLTEVTPGEAEAMRNDDVAAFHLHFSLAGHVWNQFWMEALATAQAWRIFFSYLHDECTIPRAMGWDKFVLFTCASNRFSTRMTRRVLEAVEFRAPGILRAARDEKGNNAYACTFLRPAVTGIRADDPTTWRWPTVPELRRWLHRQMGCPEMKPMTDSKDTEK